VNNWTPHARLVSVEDAVRQTPAMSQTGGSSTSYDHTSDCAVFMVVPGVSSSYDMFCYLRMPTRSITTIIVFL
jgi:hypothetical protein